MDELSARRLRNVIPVLTEQRNILVSGGVSFAAHLVDLAIMQLRLTLNFPTKLYQFCASLRNPVRKFCTPRATAAASFPSSPTTESRSERRSRGS